MRYLYFLLLTLYIISCQQPKYPERTEKRTISRCSYVPEEDVLAKLDTLTRQHKYDLLDSVYYYLETDGPDEQLYLVNLKLRKSRNLGNGDSVKYYSAVAEKLFKEHPAINASLKAWYYSTKAIDNSQNSGVMDTSIYYYRKALDLYRQQGSELCVEGLKIYGFMASDFYNYFDELDSALYYSKLQESYFEKMMGVETARFSNFYLQARIEKAKQNYAPALSYADLAIDELASYEVPDSSNLAIAHFLRGNIEYEFNLADAAEKDFRKAIEIAENYRINRYYIHHFTIGLIHLLSDKNEIAESEEWIDRLLNDSPENIHRATLFKARAINKIKNIQYEDAIFWLRKSITAFNNLNDTNYDQLAESYFFMSILLRERGQLKEALQYGENALATLTGTLEFDLNLFSLNPITVHYLGQIGAVYASMASEKKEKGLMEKAGDYFERADSLLEHIYYYVDEDVVIANQQNLDAYYDLHFNYCLNYIKLINDNIGKNSLANVVSQYKGKGLKTEQLLNRSDDPFFIQMHTIKTDIERLKYDLITASSSQYDSISKLLVDHYKTIDSLSFVGSKTNKSVHNSKGNLLSAVQQYCNDNHKIVFDYFMPEGYLGNDVGYLCVYGANDFQIIKIDSLSSILRKSEKLYYLLAQKGGDKTETDALLKDLYNGLFGDIDDDMFVGYSLVIIPDRELHLLPFDLLIDKRGNHILENNDVSYAFSLESVVRKYLEREKAELKNILAFAYSDIESMLNPDSNTLHELPGSYLEVEAIKDIYGKRVKAFSGKKATKDRFMKYAPKYDVLHLALHGKADNRSRFQSRLYFRGDEGMSTLYPHELLAADINPELMVLSACESGKGRNFQQEGMYSVARAFYAGGARHVISALWELDDTSTSEIMGNFYRSVKKNPQKGMAQHLRLAKLEYLEKHKSQATSEFYSLWGGLVGYE